MSPRPRLALPASLLAFIAAAIVCYGAGDEKPAEPDSDEQTLREAGLRTEDASLLAFLGERSNKDADLLQLNRVITQLGSGRFQEREEAAKKLVAIGPAAMPALREALKSTDKEVARLAGDCLKSIDQGYNPAILLAAVRLLARRAPADAIPTLLRYLPYCADEAVEEEIWFGIDRLVRGRGMIDPALSLALKDPLAPRRALAGCILGRVGNTAERALVRQLLGDVDRLVRLRVAQGLLAAKDERAIPALIRLLAEPPVPIAWQAEELLHWIAGNSAPEPTVGAGDTEQVERCRRAWETWWGSTRVKLEKGEWPQTLRWSPILILVGEYGSSRPGFGRPGRLWLCGSNGRPLWALEGFDPVDMSLLPNGRVLVAERHPTRRAAAERDLKGRVHWQHEVPGLLNCGRLPSGNTHITFSHGCMEVTAPGKVFYSTPRFRDREDLTWLPNQRLPNGNILCSLPIGLPMLLECDPITGLEKKRIITEKPENSRSLNFDRTKVLPGGGFLVVQRDPDNRVIEFSRAGRILWQYQHGDLTGFAAPLPNGNVLLSCWANRGDRIVEIDRSSTSLIWDVKVEDGSARITPVFRLLQVAFGMPIATKAENCKTDGLDFFEQPTATLFVEEDP